MDREKKVAIERGKRLKSLRELAGLNIVDLAKLAGLSRVSISYWENASRKNLTSSGAHKVIAALYKIGVECDPNWLLSGIGNPPHMMPKITIPFNQTDNFLKDIPNSQDFAFSLNKEIELFLTMNKDAVIAKVEDDLMLPMCEKGDIVGGIWRDINTVTTTKNAILKINSMYIVRNLSKNKNTLSISHLNLKIADAISFQEFKPDLIAPVIRVWKY